MRLAVAYSYRGKIGGIESYLDSVIKGLAQGGHQLSYWYEVSSNANSDQIELPHGVPAWCVEELGIERALEALREWKPDLIYSQGLLDPRLEETVLNIAPAVIFAHGYYGTCVSGSKTFARPTAVPCDRRFGTKCLLNYHVRGCGGLSPITMFKEYARQSARLNSLKEYKAIITASDFMRAEFVNNGIAPEKVHRVPLPLRWPADEAFRRKTSSNGHYQDAASEIETNRLDADAKDSDGNSKREWHLLFLGRMTPLKGGEMLIDALAKVSAALNKPLRVTFAGDGKQRAAWVERADRMQARYRELQFNFPGWVSGPELEATVRASDLLVVPSIWPEPFGLVGPEAGLKMVPAAAFAVGGIGDWLTDGVNGFLAPGDPPTANGLAEAIIKCLRDPRTYARLRAGAFELAQRFSMQNHLAALGEIFSTVTSDK